MDNQMKLGMMQQLYAAALAESVNTYAALGALEKVVERKAARKVETGKWMNSQLGNGAPEEVFTSLTELMNCARWEINKTETGFEARAAQCRLMALSNQMGGARPCEGWCLNPMKGMLMAMGIDEADIQVKSTLHDGKVCELQVKL